MKHRTFLLVVGGGFSAIAVLHLLRLTLRWEATIGGLVLPMWVSWLAVVAAGCLAISAYRLRNKI